LSNKKATHTNSQSGRLRIIGGIWRGRKLQFPDIEGLRPTGDRIRETLFNWLMPNIQGAHCLDLFAGSGALGLEALSRGAASSILLEQHPLAANQLREHLQRLDAKNTEILTTDSLNWLAHTKPNTHPSFDIVFVDPPFALNLWQKTTALLEQNNWLADNALVYIESPKEISLLLPDNWQLYKDKKAGSIRYQLYQRT
jgi:16S rRNA (guanine966-N2)-methyltransferase